MNDEFRQLSLLISLQPIYNTMSLLYPTPNNYKIQQSQIRYYHNVSNRTKQKVLKYLFAYKQLSRCHTIKSCLLIDCFKYFVAILKKWDLKSKEINGWSSCYLTVKIINGILNGLQKKFGYFSKDIRFSNVETLYQLSFSDNQKITPLNNLIFGLLIAIEDHPSNIDFSELLQIIECLAQRQLLYSIANYKSRGKRTYQLPWERIDDPVIEYRKKYIKQREKIIELRKKLNPDRKQSKIDSFFKRKVILNDEDDKILELLDYLDNDE